MNIVSIEPTPSPNTMKLNMDFRVERGKTYRQENRQSAPNYIQQLLDIDGVTSVFQTADFIAIDRNPKADWKVLLSKAREVFGQSSEAQDDVQVDEHYGEVRLFVQTFRGIPMQIRVKTDLEEVRKALPDRFTNEALEAGLASPNLIKERKLEDRGIRYGDLEDIAVEVLEEIEAAYDDERLKQLSTKAKAMDAGQASADEFQDISLDDALAALDDPDWRRRFAIFERLAPEHRHMAAIEKALTDEHVSIRRLAVVYLGEIGTEDVMPYLIQAMQDRSAVIRRTTGDTMSDLGNPLAIPVMIEALKDRNKLVRWRAARFLYEVGDESALAALKEAIDDPEFEVSMQAAIAVERIAGGEQAEGAVWQQMTRARSQR